MAPLDSKIRYLLLNVSAPSTAPAPTAPAPAPTVLLASNLPQAAPNKSGEQSMLLSPLVSTAATVSTASANSPR